LFKDTKKDQPEIITLMKEPLNEMDMTMMYFQDFYALWNSVGGYLTKVAMVDEAAAKYADEYIRKHSAMKEARPVQMG